MPAASAVIDSERVGGEDRVRGNHVEFAQECA